MNSLTPSVELSFLWHMHQPDYRDGDGIMRMPWVFLHAIKDYYDMPWMLSKFPKLRASFNITPPLIEQLNLYKEPLKNDYFLKLWHKNPNELSSEERVWLTKTCKSANYEMMIKPNRYYTELYNKEKLSDDELIDIEVLFILAWCGPYLRLHNSTLQLLLKQKSYTIKDKENLFNLTVKFVATILPFYKSLLESQRIAISTTPYNHPILPLLIDMENITKANPQSSLPQEPISLYDDAKEQVRRAVELYKDTFKRDPVGFWPAEGAVDEASVAIYKEFGIEWIATDEAVLFNSLGSDERSALYKPYSKDGLNIYFRDHGLSDLFGFDYRFKAPSEAVEHFIGSIKGLIPTNKETNSVFIILDGENAWEYYQSNGYAFFMQLYEELSEYDWCKTLTMDSVSSKNDAIPLANLASGSWIYGDFTTWSGHPEKNRAWELIFETKRAYLANTRELDTKTKELIEFHFLASECSDWFWWYGDDHSTSFALEFDRLFRDHLIAIYRLLQQHIPPSLLVPIIQDKDFIPFLIPPTNLISPTVDSKDNFFGWVGAGTVDESRIFSTMDRVRGPLNKIRFGFNDKSIFIALEGDMEKVKGGQIIISSQSLPYPIEISLTLKNHTYNHLTIYIDKDIKIALPYTLFKSLDKISLGFEIRVDNKIIQTLPGYGLLEIDLKEEYSKHWFI